MIWFTADQHFFHERVLELESRPFCDIYEMNNAIITRYNRLVKKDDIVYFLGDVSFGKYQETEDIINRMNGIKHLLIGNHDSFTKTQYCRMGFFGMNKVLKLPDLPFVLAHDSEMIPGGSFGICGHVHGREKYYSDKRFINVGVDAWDYAPASYNDVYNVFLKNKHNR